MTISRIRTSVAGQGLVSMTKYTGGCARPSRDEIARLAHHLYEMRGRGEGQDVDDWLSAEQKLLRHYR